MSSILKALRRLEEEKARKSHIAPEISASLLREGTRRRQSPLWLWPTVVSFVILTVAVLLFWFSRQTPQQIRVVASSPPAMTSPGVSSAGHGGGVIIEEVIDQQQPGIRSVSYPPVSATPLPFAKVRPELPVASEVVTPVVVPVKPALAIEERQNPVVSAIAWQDDSSARMAVVDGLPVMTGESIGTARVAEIQRDRILFEESGIFFAVRLNAQ